MRKIAIKCLLQILNLTFFLTVADFVNHNKSLGLTILKYAI